MKRGRGSQGKSIECTKLPVSSINYDAVMSTKMNKQTNNNSRLTAVVVLLRAPVGAAGVSVSRHCGCGQTKDAMCNENRKILQGRKECGKTFLF